MPPPTNNTEEHEDEIPLLSYANHSPIETITAPLPVNTPTRPRAMREFWSRDRSDDSSPFSRSRPSRQEHEPRKRRRVCWSREVSPSPRGGRNKDVVHDHWSPSGFNPRSSTPARELFLFHSSGSRPEYRTLRTSNELAVRANSICSEKEVVIDEQATEEAAMEKTYHRLSSIAIPVGSDLVCYNCSQKGHYFMDCSVGCGRCGGDGHKTMDCDFLGKGKGIKMEEAEEEE